MLNKKLKLLIAAALIGATIFTGLTFLKKPKIETTQINIKQLKIDYSESIIEKLESINKLEIMQAYLTQEITLKGKYDNFLFRNNKTITVKANGIYKLDLDSIKGNLIIGTDEVTVLASMETDVIFHDFEYSSEKGLFVFADLQFTPEEYEVLLNEVKGQMITKMFTKDYIEEVKKKAEDNISDKVREATNKYKVKVVWINEK